MSDLKAGGKWIAGLHPRMPVAEAAGLVLEPRLESVVNLLHLPAQQRQGKSTEDNEAREIRRVHQLRVATRRSAAAIRFFRVALKKKRATRCRTVLRDIRRAAGEARTLDVHRQILLGMADGTADPFGLEPLNDAERSAIADAALWLEAARANAEHTLRRTEDNFADDELRYRFGHLLMSARPPKRAKGRKETAPPIHTLADLARHSLPGILEPLRDAVDASTLTMEQLHGLRIVCKRARYAAEICWPMFVDPADFEEAASNDHPAWEGFERGPYASLVAIQDRLGKLNDGHEIGLRLSTIGNDLGEHSPSTKNTLLGLASRLEQCLAAERDAFLGWWWGEPKAHRFLDELMAVVQPELIARAHPHALKVNSEEPTMPHRRKPTGSGSASGHDSDGALRVPVLQAPTIVHESFPTDPAPDSSDQARPGETKRIAAIDVGTNSLRLVVAEARADGWFRVVDDEKAVTRLGKGLAETGRMQPETIAISAQAIARMRVIAEGYAVEKIRVIGTAAARDAENSNELIDAVRDTAGLELEIISPSEEARLAVRSVDHAFHLENMHAAVVDIGGGSTEIVLTANGLIDQVFPLKLGAVRLTEQFGTCEPGAPTSEHQGYDALKAFVRNTFREKVGKLDFIPQMLFGTGGIFTSLASISMNGSVDRPLEMVKSPTDGPSGAMLPFKIRGYELRRSEVKHILDRVRKLSVRDRARVPGMSPDRAEIAVAGLTIVEAVMKHLGINVLRVHDRGIREGLLLEMIDELFDRPPAAGSASHREKLDRFSAAKRFATACHYEEPHALHVAELAMSIFDQLVFALDAADEPWASGVARELVASASLLHDVGYLINYAKHHKHSYHLIRHSDMPGFTPRELEIVANIARYHRRAEPKKKHPNFARLNEADRGIVSKLSAITRLADGLARSHTRNVRRVHLNIADGVASFTLIAANDPSVDLWGAQRKSSLFEREFELTARFAWLQENEASDLPSEPKALAHAIAERSSEIAAPPPRDSGPSDKDRAKAPTAAGSQAPSPQDRTSA